MINVVVFNGGRGARNLIPSLASEEGINLTSIVNAYDDGKSTGVLRNFFKMLGPSDIRKVQETILPPSLIDIDGVQKMYDFRFDDKIKAIDIIFEIKQYIENKRADFFGINLKEEVVEKCIKKYLSSFINGMALIEKCERKIFNFNDCSLMNIIYTGAFLYYGGNFEDAILQIGKLFRLKAHVLSTNNENKKLVAIREDGTILYNEAEIVELRSNVRIKKIYLLDEYPIKEIVEKLDSKEVEAYFELMNRQVFITNKVKNSIESADIIIYSSGTQHSSLYPSYMTCGLSEAIASNKTALKVFITNIGEDYETPSYEAADFINGALRYLSINSSIKHSPNDLISYALVNNKFTSNKENYVVYNIDDLNKIGLKYIIDEFEDENNCGKHNGMLMKKFILNLYNKLKNAN